MDLSIAEQFVILALNPRKGRISLNNIHFRYSLTGALLMDFFERGEISIDNKRVIPSFRKNGENLHDFIAEKIMKSNKNRRISLWIRRLTYKNRFLFKEIIKSLEKQKIVRIEQRKFLNIFPYYRYWINDSSIRIRLIDLLRGILVYGKLPGKKEIMLLGLIEASKAYKLLSMEKGESKQLRRKNSELLKEDILSPEISMAIRELQKAIVASITAAIIASHGAH